MSPDLPATTRVPSAASAASTMSFCVVAAIVNWSPHAAYDSSIVNSAECEESMPSLRKIRPTSYTRSAPPTMARLRNSSRAIRIVMSMSKALRCVRNGRAAAPPWIVCSTGVSTSRKPSLCRVSRMDRMTAERVRRLSRASWRTMRSA